LAAQARPVFDVVLPHVEAVAPVAPAPDDRPVVFRYAPTTKADMGVSGARIALLNYLAAKKAGGHLLVRFEDTDAEKAKPEGIQSYKDALAWLGIHYEGEPATQSQRKAVHSARADALIQAGKAYQDETGAVLFRMPKEGELSIHDKVKGLTIAKATDEDMKDYIIRNADGTPSPLFASVVDDADSGVTRVIRAEANLKDALRAQPLYEALGHRAPEYWHIPGLKGDDGKKLQGPTISEMRAKGYQPLAVANHLVRLGLDDVKDPQTLPLDQLAAQTDFKFKPESTMIGLPDLDKRNQEHK
jgi:glutamyl-tRNA synthetase